MRCRPSGIPWLVLVGATGLCAMGEASNDNPLAFELESGKSQTITWPWPVTDANLANPSGYFPAAPPKHRIVERVTVRNAGDTGIRNPKLTINGQDHLTVNSVLGALGLESPVSLDSIFSAWKERRVHDTSGMKENGRAIDVLRAFGVTLCGDDSKALADIITGLGGTARPMRLIGHVAYEYSLGGETAVVDGDQNIFYTRLDNSTPASEDDLRADPLLVLRARVFGRQMPYQLAASWMNASRFDQLDKTTPEPRKARTKTSEVDWELLPGEWIEFDPTSDALTGIYAASPEVANNPILREAVIAVKFHVHLAARRSRGDRALSLPFPAVSWLDADGAAQPLIPNDGKLAYDVTLTDSMPDRLVVHCQAAKAIFPGLPLATNDVEFSSVTANSKLSLEWKLNTAAPALRPVPPPAVKIGDHLPFGVPVVSVDGQGADALWWQVSDDSGFDHVLGNFDVVQKPSDVIRIASPIETTFFTRSRTFFFRIKQQVGGVWSGWSEPVAFDVNGPAAPTGARATATDGKCVVTWNPSNDEVWIFGSNRMDFVPEIFSLIDPTRLENNVISASIENKNLLLKTPGTAGRAEVPAFAFYRLIAHQRGMLSVPSALVRTQPPDDLPASILQNQHQKPATDIATPISLQ